MMNKNDIKQQITVLLEKIQEQVKKINKSENDISQEEMDSMLSDTRDLYEKTVGLTYLNSPQTIASLPEEEEKASIEVETQKESVPVEEEIADPVSTETSVENEAIEEVAEEEKPQIDLFATPKDEQTEQEEQTTVNEKIALQEDVQSVASELERKPITDLKSAIGINEKFLFINDLFGGSTEDYNDSLNHLNECKDHAEADTYINDNLKVKYHWDEENNAVSVFLDLVGRRYL